MANLPLLLPGIQARCPACAAAGQDTKGVHLKIFADGKYACAANQGANEHSKEIFKLAGAPFNKATSGGKARSEGVRVTTTKVLVDLSSVDRFRRKKRPDDAPADQAA